MSLWSFICARFYHYVTSRYARVTSHTIMSFWGTSGDPYNQAMWMKSWVCRNVKISKISCQQSLYRNVCPLKLPWFFIKMSSLQPVDALRSSHMTAINSNLLPQYCAFYFRKTTPWPILIVQLACGKCYQNVTLKFYLLYIEKNLPLE